MAAEKINTVVVGGGPAGLAISEHLGRWGVSHLVLERGRVAERWRSERWDSLVTNGPAWHDRFPNMEFVDIAPDTFVPKESVANYFSSYAEMISAPIRCGVEVRSVERNLGSMTFRIVTSEGVIEANNVVAATGAFQNPVIPRIIPDEEDVQQIHSSAYRNASELREGAVLVVGAGSSGVQIADELLRAGRSVYLSVGPHDRPPRAYRGRDYCWWLGVLGKWDSPSPNPGAEHVTIAVSGAHGGETVDFRRLAARGMTLVGQTKSYVDGSIRFASDLVRNIARGDENYLSVLDEADAYATQYGLDLPEEPSARDIGSDPQCMIEPILELSLSKAGIKSIVWATGYSFNYSWLKVDALDEAGRPNHVRGVSPEKGVYFVGLPWQSRRGSSFIWGVWHDASYIADHIAIQGIYQKHHNSIKYDTQAA